MEIEDRIRLETPEGVPLDLQLAGVGSRLSAAIVDAAIQGVMLIGLAVVVGVTGSAGSVALAALLSFAIVWGYDVLFETLASGRTPGKRVQGLRVVLVDGSSVTFLAALVRNLLRLVDFLPGLYAAGIVSILVTRQNQRLGDLVAGTLVVRERRPADVYPPGLRTGVPAPARDAEGWDVTAVSDEELNVAAAFLARRTTLPAEVRERVAAQVAARLRARVVGPDEGTADEALIERVVARRLGGDG